MGYRGCGLYDRGGVYLYPFGDDALRAGEYGDDSLLMLSLCELGVNVVEDVGRVQVQVVAREGLCPLFWYVARVVE